MGLTGRLEDLPFLDMLQIAAFSQKRGYLRVEGPPGSGAVVFKMGLVHCAYSWSTREHLRFVAQTGLESVDEQVLEKQVELSLRELAGLREGTFEFELAEEIGAELDGLDISAFLKRDGINPQHMLLDLARNMDEERRDAIELIESSETVIDVPSPLVLPPAPLAVSEDPPLENQRTTVVLVDDEPDIVDVVGDELESRGFRVARASGPAEGAALAEERQAAGENVLVVTDLKMPTSAGDSFQGGFELVEQLNRREKRVPVLLMSEGLSPEDRKRAIELGIRKAAFKPTLTKPDPKQYREDLKAFAGEILRQLEILSSAPEPERETPRPEEAAPEEATLLLDYLASMAHHIVNPQRQTEVTRIVLQMAAKYMERGILFLVKKDKALGLAAFGISDDDKESTALARRLQVAIKEAEAFAEVVQSKSVFGPTKKLDSLEASIYSHIGRGEASEAVLMPMLNNGEVLTILYGDNAKSGKPLGRSSGLELMLTQAGMALENALLQRKLKTLSGGRPVEDVPV